MPPPAEGSITEYQTLAEFRYQLRRFLRFSEQTARTAGFEPQQHQLLLAVKGLPQGRKATIGTLAERLQLPHHTPLSLIHLLFSPPFIHPLPDYPPTLPLL